MNISQFKSVNKEKSANFTEFNPKNANNKIIRKILMKKDIKQVNDIAKEYKMSQKERQEFRRFLEKEKKRGVRGTKNERGDYTYEELGQKAREFLENRGS